MRYLRVDLFRPEGVDLSFYQSPCRVFDEMLPR
jgi:hypothetical protein